MARPRRAWGELPPDAPHIWRTLGYRGVEQGDGRSVIEWEATPEYCFHDGNGGFIVHGGMVTTLLDTAMGGACWSVITGDETFLTADLHAEFMRSARPGVIQGRLEEMGVTELMQSLDMGQKSCRLTLQRNAQRCELYFAGGQCKDARLGELEGDEVIYQIVGWTDGEFEIDFGASSERVNTTRSTTGLLMEAMRLLDEAHSERVEH